METEQTSPDRDYSTISPSARALLMLKGLTDIPFALEAAKLISGFENYQPDFSINEAGFWARVLHFESRYKSINQLMSTVPVKNIMELSSGFSFRGLNTVINEEVHYIDTDLPEVIAGKLKLLKALQMQITPPKGGLETLPLNALDESNFVTVTNRFAQGEVVIVNEGLLVYLDTREKRKLCQNIRAVLQKRGGYWITADIYIKSEKKFQNISPDDKLQQFFREHHIEENKFNSFAEGEDFFKSEGFVIDKEAVPDRQASGSLKYLLASAGKEQLEGFRKAGNIRASWRLRLG